VTARALTPLRSYFEHEVAAIWRARHAVSADSKGGTRLELWDRKAVEASLDAIERRFAQFVEVPWRREEILADRPGKWKHTYVALVDEDIAGFSFNSVRAGWLYVHAFFVAPEHRHRGLGRLLVNALSRRARGAGLTGVRLRVACTNTAAIHFYLQCGFAIERVEPVEGQLVMELAASRTRQTTGSS
jgi:ribosomal protein S18 acetylase RimI-like enzyme